MAFLGSFEYDIFLSYGWAGNRTPEEGDRAWIKTVIGSQAERSGALGEAPESAVEGSAFLLLAASPGTSCPAEVRHFLGRARPPVSQANALTAEQRIPGTLCQRVPRAGQPHLLANMGFRPYELFHELDSRPPRLTRPADLAAVRAPADDSFHPLARSAGNSGAATRAHQVPGETENDYASSVSASPTRSTRPR